MLQVSIMIFVGFGFLMTFLRHYSYSAVGFNFFASCLVMLEAILALGFTQQASDNPQNSSHCKARQPALEGGLNHSLFSGPCTFFLQSLATSPKCIAALHRLSLRQFTRASSWRPVSTSPCW